MCFSALVGGNFFLVGKGREFVFGIQGDARLGEFLIFFGSFVWRAGLG